jgi:ParB family chromosome partitioning protein
MREKRTKNPPRRGPASPRPAAVITTLPADTLHPNEYNPNRMTEAEYAELVAEVRHLKRLPKPVVVRPDGDGYTIVDGEHGWRAANVVGLSEVPCEIIEADDFEAMRQTYKRNQHGTHDPLLLGRMFRRMMESRSLSARSLAEAIAVSEGTVRNALLYAEAGHIVRMALRVRYVGVKL